MGCTSDRQTDVLIFHLFFVNYLFTTEGQCEKKHGFIRLFLIDLDLNYFLDMFFYFRSLDDLDTFFIRELIRVLQSDLKSIKHQHTSQRHLHVYMLSPLVVLVEETNYVITRPLTNALKVIGIKGRDRSVIT